MVRRLFETVTGAAGDEERGPLRPNQLRLQDVVVQRQRRQAARPAPSAPAPAPPPRPARQQAAPLPPARSSSLREMLSSRRGLRQALLLREVLDPPLALRDPASDRFRF